MVSLVRRLIERFSSLYRYGMIIDNLEAEWLLRFRLELLGVRGVSKQAFAKLIRWNRLSAGEIGSRMLVRRSEVEAFVPMPIGRPRKKTALKKQAFRLLP